MPWEHSRELALWQDHQPREVGGAALGGGRLSPRRNAGSDPEPTAVTSPDLSVPVCEARLLEGVGEISLDSQCSVIGRLCHVCFLLPAGSLQLLEQQVVGGEQAKNKDLKEKHRRRKRYADERKKQLVAALQNSDEDSGDWVLLNVYDSIQEEVRAKSKLLEKMQRKVRPGSGPAPRQAPPRRSRPPGRRTRWAFTPGLDPCLYPTPAVCHALF